MKDKRSLLFEGPNIKDSREDIEMMLKKLTDGDPQCKVQIRATKKSGK